jgi:hypothetical protein
MARGRHALIVLSTATASAAVAIGLCAAPALAATPSYTVKVTGGGSYTATTPKTILTDGQVSVTCTSTKKAPASEASGSIPTGTDKGKAPVKVGTAAKLSFNNCSGPLGAVKTKIESTPYTVSVDSKTNSKGQTDGLIAGVKVAVSMTACSFTVTGSAPGYYTNGKHTLTMTSKLQTKASTKAQLTVSGVKGCAGLVKNGDHPSYTGTYTLSRKGTVKSS